MSLAWQSGVQPKQQAATEVTPPPPIATANHNPKSSTGGNDPLWHRSILLSFILLAWKIVACRLPGSYFWNYFISALEWIWMRWCTKDVGLQLSVTAGTPVNVDIEGNSVEENVSLLEGIWNRRLFSFRLVNDTLSHFVFSSCHKHDHGIDMCGVEINVFVTTV